MSSFLEFEGKKVEQAIQKACKKFKVSDKQLKYEVVSYGSTGIFGLVGTKKARIRVEVPGENAPLKPKQKASVKNRETPAPESETSEKEESEESSDKSEIADFGKDVVERILTAISPESTVTVEQKNDRLYYKISGGNSGVLIGKKGQTLDAVQYLVEKIINKKCNERVRIQIDVEGYLENKKDTLQELAGKLADKVKKTGKPVTVGHMTANDRRIVHLALKKDNKVRTQSMGDGFIKKLVIFPKRKQPSRKKKAV